MTVHLRSARFRQERSASWRELERLVSKIESKGLRRLQPNEMRSLPRLYRAALSSLSVARAVSLDLSLVAYLEHLTTRAYTHVYSVRTGFLKSVWHFFSSYYPRLFRKYGIHMLIAGCLLVGGTVVGHIMVMNEPEYYYSFVNENLAGGRGPNSTPEELRSVLYGSDADMDDLASFAGFLFVHNSQVAGLCFVLGIVPGALVFYLLLTNGFMLGAFSAIHERAGLSVDLWGWLLPHGVTELFAIVVAAGGGLALGQSLLFPGRSRRLQNLATAGREVSSFLLMAFLMLAFAGFVEGIFRQVITDIHVRYFVASASALFWILYLTIGGRGRFAPKEGRA